MKKLFLFSVVLLTIITSCTTVAFETPQPKNSDELSEFPQELIGIYIDKDSDTLTIKKNSFKYGNKKTTAFHMEEKLTPNKIILKKCEDSFVINLRDTSSNIWNVFIFKKNKKNILVYYIDLGKDNKEEIINNLKDITTAKEIKNKKGEIEKYIINPTKKEFKLLIDSKIFSKVNEFKQLY
ncbi:MAG: hypothetical protein DRJ01_02795 [Bacteroidetes bacterium]|nr:MAG: hypothetical protein DRJ01_02795 [Bacteroidota bacterium]